MRSWQHGPSEPVALAEVTYETILAIRSFCETSSMDHDITNRGISRPHVYHKLRHLHKGHMNEQNPKPSIPRLLAIRTLTIQGQLSSEGIATHTQDQIFTTRLAAALMPTDPCSGCTYVDITTTGHGYTGARRCWQNSPCPSSSKGGGQRAGECVTAAPVYALRGV
jgi:hypothetical protein